MQATQAEFGTTPGQDYIKSLFSDIPADVRFSSVKYEPVPPNTAIGKHGRNQAGLQCCSAQKSRSLQKTRSVLFLFFMPILSFSCSHKIANISPLSRFALKS